MCRSPPAPPRAAALPRTGTAGNTTAIVARFAADGAIFSYRTRTLPLVAWDQSIAERSSKAVTTLAALTALPAAAPAPLLAASSSEP